MTYTLGAKSKTELNGVHPALQEFVEETIKLTEQDFTVYDGLRTEAEQREYVRRGVSKTMNSMHMKQSDGFGHATDLVPWINGQARWEWKPIFVIAAAARKALDAVNDRRAAAGKNPLVVTWGGVWDRSLKDLPADAKGMEQAVNSYVARRRAAGKTAFIDGPHFQMEGHA